MIRNTISALLAAIWIASALSTAAAAANDRITAKITPGDIVGIMQQAGYTAYVDEDGENDPMIIARGDEGKFGVVFFDCEARGALADRHCTDLEFTAYFEVDGRPSLARLNEWNAGQAFGKAYVNGDGDVVLEMPVNLRHGVSESYVISGLEWWQSVMSRFGDHIWPK